MKTYSAIFVGLLAVGTVACGDDDGGGNLADAGGSPDGNGGADANNSPDAGPTIDLTSPEGGEIRFEYIDFIDDDTEAGGGAPGGRDDATRLTGFFYRGGTGDFPAFEFGTCIDVSDDSVWPFAQADTREYIDVGDIVVHGGPQNLTVAKTANLRDPFNRAHFRTVEGVDTAEPWYFHFGVNDSLTFTSPNTEYDVILTGSDEWPAQFYPNALAMPAAFTPGTPGLENINLEPDTPVTITWDPVDTTVLQPGDEVVSLVAFVVAGQGPVVLCTETEDGEVTVPAEMVNKVLSFGAAAGGFARQTLIHRIQEFKNDDDVAGRRIDFVGVWCFATLWKAPPPA